MRLTIVFDNTIFNKDIGLKSGWGFSCLVETKTDTILFDTGEDGNVLLKNMEILEINPKKISKIVISHEHYDHNGGLDSLLSILDKSEVYRVKNFESTKNVHFIFSEKNRQITEDIYTTGRLEGSVDEQSLILQGNKGWYLIVGCSHPGVGRIFDVAKFYGDIVGVIGGLHGFNDYSLFENLELICATHCTQHKKEIYRLFPNTTIEGGVGQIIDI